MMFSVDDSFDIDDEEFARVAGELELDPQPPPTKRRSFDIGSTGHDANLEHGMTRNSKENRHPNSAINLHPGPISRLVNPAVNHSTPATRHVNSTVTRDPAQWGIINTSTSHQPSNARCGTTISAGNKGPQHAAPSGPLPTLSHGADNLATFGQFDDLDDLDLSDDWVPDQPEHSASTLVTIAAPSVVPQSVSTTHRPAPPSAVRHGSNLPNSKTVGQLRQRTNQTTAPRVSSTSHSEGPASHINSQNNHVAQSKLHTPMCPLVSEQDTQYSTTGHKMLVPATPEPLTPAMGQRTHEPSALTPAMTTATFNIGSVTPTVDTTSCLTVETPGEETPSSANSSSSSRKRKRKFPGPAGILPRLKKGMKLSTLKLDTPITPQHKPKTKTAELACSQDGISSQGGDDVFSDGPWKTMKSELERRAEPILNMFPLAVIVRKAGQKQLPRGKVPITAGLIEELQVHAADASCVLRDRGSRMKATIHRQLVKDCGLYLVPGSVLLLRQVGVFSPSVRSHYLNITPSNMVRLYYRLTPTDPIQCHRGITFTDEDFIIPALPATPATPAVTPGGQGSLTPLLTPRQPQPGNSRLPGGLNQGGPHHSVNTPGALNKPGAPNTPGAPRSQLYNLQSRAQNSGSAVAGPNYRPYSHRPPGIGTGTSHVSAPSHNPTMRPARRLQVPSTPQAPGAPQTLTSPPGDRKFSFRHSPRVLSSAPRSTAPTALPQPGVSSTKAGHTPVTRTAVTPGLHSTSSTGLRPRNAVNSVQHRAPTQNPIPAAPSHSAQQSTPTNDLWGDDKLEDLMSGLDDEMFNDF